MKKWIDFSGSGWYKRSSIACAVLILWSFTDFASPQHSPSHGLPPPKHPRLDTEPSSPLTTLHPTSTVTAGPHQDPGYESTSTAASLSLS